MKTRYALLGVVIGIVASSCVSPPSESIPPSKSVGISVSFPARERKEAEHLLRLIYTPRRNSYSLRCVPDGSFKRQTATDLRLRLHKIRVVPGNIAFKLIITGKTGEYLSTLTGVLQRESGDIEYTNDSVILDRQPINVSLKFLAWYDHTSVISFCDHEAANFRSEHFKLVHGSRSFKMTLSSEAIVDPPFTSDN